MTIDFGQGPYKAIKEKYPEIIIILCFYHYINMIRKKLSNNFKDLKNKQNIYLEILYIIIILPFIDLDNVRVFFNNIKKNIINIIQNL